MPSGRALMRIVKTVELQLKCDFTNNPGWEYEKTLGHGTYGLTILLKDKDPLGIRRRRPYRRIVLKRQLVPERGMSDFVAEITALEKLRGHAHIAQMIDHTMSTEYYRGRRGRTAEFLRRIMRVLTNYPENIFKTLSPHRGPAILLEYLEGGSMYDFVIRQIEKRVVLPNRILWSIFYCLVRACVAMTYAKKAPYGEPLELEELHPDEDHLLLLHGDIAFRNLMFDDYEDNVPEHNVAPKVVLIDFGMSRPANAFEGFTAGRAAEMFNMQECLTLMAQLIYADFVPSAQFYVYNLEGQQSTQAWQLIPWGGRDPFPWLDDELRYLIVEGLSDLKNRPTLEQMLRRTRRGAMKPASAYGARAVDESDQACCTVLQQLMYNAPEDPDIF